MRWNIWVAYRVIYLTFKGNMLMGKSDLSDFLDIQYKLYDKNGRLHIKFNGSYLFLFGVRIESFNKIVIYEFSI